MLKNKLNEAIDRLNSLESVEDYQMDELNAKKNLVRVKINIKFDQNILIQK